MCGCTPLSDTGVTPGGELELSTYGLRSLPVHKLSSVTKYVIRGQTAKSGDLSGLFRKSLAWCCGFLVASEVTVIARDFLQPGGPPIQPPGFF
jgi:hypothetical protein